MTRVKSTAVHAGTSGVEACSRCHSQCCRVLEPDEDAIRRQQVLMAAIACSLRRERQGVDEDKACERSCADLVVDDGVRGESHDIAERSGVERDGRRRVEVSRCRVINAKYWRVWWPIVTVMLGVIDRCRMAILLSMGCVSVNLVQTSVVCRVITPRRRCGSTAVRSRP